MKFKIVGEYFRKMRSGENFWFSICIKFCIYIVKISSYIIIRYKSILGGRNSIKFLD